MAPSAGSAAQGPQPPLGIPPAPCKEATTDFLRRSLLCATDTDCSFFGQWRFHHAQGSRICTTHDMQGAVGSSNINA